MGEEKEIPKNIYKETDEEKKSRIVNGRRKRNRI